MRTYFHRFTCPYCFNQPRLGEAKFMCANEPRFCTPVVDEVYARFWERPGEVRPRVFSFEEGETARVDKSDGIQKYWHALRKAFYQCVAPVSAWCPLCDEESTDMVCPVCHTALPYRTGHHDELLLGVIGAKESGKSHYVAMLIELIQKQMAKDFQCSLTAANDITPARYKNDFYSHLFRNRRTIPATLPAAQGGTVKEPLIYYLTFTGKRAVTRAIEMVSRRRAAEDRDTTKVATLEFFDTAGEDLDSEDTIRRENRYIFRSRGLVLLLDPLQLDVVRQKLKGSVPLPNKNTENDEILDRVTRLIRKANKFSLDTKIDIPLAIAFSKCDAIEGLLQAEGVSLRQSWNGGVFDLSEFAVLNREMENLVEQWVPGLVSKIRKNFRHCGFFAVSALGSAPDPQGRVSELKPLRVLDPYLWLLAKNGVVRTVGSDEISEISR